MDNARKRKPRTLEAYYTATAMFTIVTALVLRMSDAPSAWCATIPITVSLAALLMVQHGGNKGGLAIACC